MINIFRAFLIVVLCFLTVFQITAYADEGVLCIDSWDSISEDGLSAAIYSADEGKFHLVISGEGKMADYSSPEAVPWYEYSESITRVTLSHGISYVGENSFLSLVELKVLCVENPYMGFPFSEYNVIPEKTEIHAHLNSLANEYAAWFHKFFKPICRFVNEPCSVCGYECSEPPPICTDPVCSVCRTTHSDTVRHKSGGTINAEIPPTCEREGRVAHSNCVYCDIPLDADENPIYELEIPSLSHRLENWCDAVAPSCTSSGHVGYYTCLRCGEFFDEGKNKITDIEIVQTEHVGGEASCSERAVCIVCTKSYGEYAPDKHSFSEGFVYDGNAHRGLCKCGAHSEYTEHTYTERTVKEPTMFSKGEREISCHCGYKIVEDIPILSVDNEEVADNAPSEPPNILIIMLISFFSVAVLCVTIFVLVKISIGKSE